MDYLPSHLSDIWVAGRFSNEEVGKKFKAEQPLCQLVPLLPSVQRLPQASFIAPQNAAGEIIFLQGPEGHRGSHTPTFQGATDPLS